MADDAVDRHLERIAARDEAAFRALYDAAGAKLLGIARRILRTSEAAEDVVHDVFVKLWTGAAVYDRRLGSGMGFLATMTRNRALDLKRRRGEAALEEMPEMQEMADLAPDPETIAADRADLRAVLACLERLAEGPRRAILSAYVDGLTGPQIAGRLAVPLGTVKTWVSRGLVALKECLGR